ncbi:hypothetical protein ACS0TY_004519 [Phlomoides rotata]
MILSIRIRDWLLKEMESYQFKSFKYKFQIEAVMNMLAYLRLGYVSDPSEMQSVLSSQGPICPFCRRVIHIVGRML